MVIIYSVNWMTALRKRISILAGILMLIQVATSAQTASLTLDSCYAMARSNYPLIKQFSLIEKSKEYTISNANRGFLPQVSITGIAGYIGGLPDLSPPGSESGGNDNFKLIGIGQVNQTIWDGGASRIQKDIAKAGAEAESALLEANLYTLKERLNQLFFGILLIDEQLNQIQLLNENLNRTYKKVQLSHENGLAFQNDVDEVQSEILLMEQKKLEYQYSKDGFLQMLSYLIGKPLDDKTTLTTPVIIEANSSLPINRPEISMYDRQRKLVESQTSINNMYNMPKIGLMGFGVLLEPGAEFGTSTMSSMYLGGLSISWNTENLFKASNNKNIDKIKLDQIRNQEEVFSFNVNMQLKQTNSDIQKQKAIVEKDDEIISLKQKIAKAYQLKYENGLCSMNDLVNSYQEESEAKSNLALHSIQLLMSQYSYKTISGN